MVCTISRFKYCILLTYVNCRCTLSLHQFFDSVTHLNSTFVEVAFLPSKKLTSITKAKENPVNLIKAILNLFPANLGKSKVNDPNEIDLRFFRSITLADTYDGKGSAHSGWERNILLYNGETVWEAQVFRISGSAESRVRLGDEDRFYRRMNMVANAYLAIVYSIRKALDLDGYDVAPHFYLEDNLFKILSEHPQYKKMLRECECKSSRVTLVIAKDASNSGQYLIQVTKKVPSVPPQES
jgi:hypothetical protein